MSNRLQEIQRQQKQELVEAPGEGDGAPVLRLKTVKESSPAVAFEAPARVPERPAKPVAPAKRSLENLPQRARAKGKAAPKKRRFFSPMMVSLLIVVGLPTTTAGTYFSFFATPQYTSEFRFSIRPADGSSGSGNTAAVASLLMSNSYIVSDYMQSLDVVSAIDKMVDLRKVYSRSDIDFLSRLDPSVSIEGLLSYWIGKTATSYDLTTGINTVEVRAFTPDDAHLIATKLQFLAENLVNNISEQARQSELTFSQKELDRAAERLSDARRKETEIRADQRTVDARKEADGKLQLMSKLRGALAEYQSQYRALASYLDKDSPKLGVLKTQVEATQQQIDELQGEVGGGTGAQGQVNDAEAIARFDSVQTDVDMATKLYESALTSYEQARARAISNQIYLATYVQPGQPQIPTYPRVLLDTLLAMLYSFGAWIVLTLIYYSIRDHA